MSSAFPFPRTLDQPAYSVSAHSIQGSNRSLPWTPHQSSGAVGEVEIFLDQSLIWRLMVFTAECRQYCPVGVREGTVPPLHSGDAAVVILRRGCAGIG